MSDRDEQVKGGPANHGAHTDLDAPTPPGGPMRQDRPDADVNPVGPVDPAPPSDDPDVQPSGTPEGPTTIPVPGTPSDDPSPHPGNAPGRPADSHPAQEENAETSLGQPSDGSGGE